MSQSIRPLRLPIIRRAQRGQMLVVALAILFVLLIIGGIFVTMIGRNLTQTARSRDDQSALELADAGIHYCSLQLETSADGADWRPVPSPPQGPNGGITDPDYRWLSVGFTRLYFNGGRALVRLLYDPRVDDPRSQYIEIQSVGRAGNLDQTGGGDPTVFVQNGNEPRQRRERIAYKQIGLTDYLFWFTNKDHRNLNQFLGIPAMTNSNGPGTVPTQLTAGQGLNDVSMVIGDPTLLQLPAYGTGLNGGEVIFGAPIYCNGNLELAGEIHIYESPRGTTAAGTPDVSAESVLCSGSVLLAPNQDINGDGVITNADQQAFLNENVKAPAANILPSTATLPNGSTAFNTFNGLIRDGSTTPDVFGYTRGVPFKDPPSMDAFEAGTGSLRYRALTRFSGVWTNGTSYNTGFNGWGTGVYVDNNADLQLETQNSAGGYTLRGDWVNPQPGAGAQSFWNGAFYRPPGVLIELLGDHIRLTRSDGKEFHEPDGNPITTGGGNVVDIPLKATVRANYSFPGDPGTTYALQPLSNDDDVAGSPTRDPNPANFPLDKNSYGVSLVIMAEGNVRVKGVYGAVTYPGDTDALARVHLTIVSGGTAYIEGNILKGDGYYDGTATHMERASTCAILAKDYVCVNTSMFMASANQALPWGNPASTAPPFFAGITSQVPYYDPTVAFGTDPTQYGSQMFLFTRHASNVEGSSSSTAMNLQINPGLDTLGNSYYNFTGANVIFPALPLTFTTPDPVTYPLGQRWQQNPGQFVPDVTQSLANFEQRVFPLTGTGAAPFVPDFVDLNNLFPTLTGGGNGPTIGYDNVFHFTKDNVGAATAANAGLTGFSEAEDYMVSATMVAPLDIRIEALLYAQERSFFVIPGYSFNQDPNDTRLNFIKSGTRSIYSPAFEGTKPQMAGTAAKDPFPFYGEPMDVRITIFGAITQNYSASPGDQAAWIGQWGYIPVTHGSSGIPIPSSHVMVHDPPIPGGTAESPGQYVPGEDPTQNTQTPKETVDGITRGLHFVYDPALALPYQHPSGIDLMTAAAANDQTRMQRSVRSKYIPPSGPVPGIVQILPSTPKLPVCPGLLYFGPSDSPVVP